MMRLSSAGFATMTRRLRDCLPRPELSGVGVVLEGGYDLQALEESMRATVGALLSDEPAAEQQVRAAEPMRESFDEELIRVQRALSPQWRL
jgi:acetoin utilization deacetylase AcuC-like enzyme